MLKTLFVAAYLLVSRRAVAAHYMHEAENWYENCMNGGAWYLQLLARPGNRLSRASGGICRTHNFILLMVAVS